MVDKKKILKILGRLQHLVHQLEERQNLKLHQHVSQFYYMETIEELIMLFKQYEEAQEKMKSTTERIAIRYEQTFHQWRRDVMWIHRCKNCRN